MRLVAIDGGGTKTDLVLLDETGRVLKRIITEGCNPNDFGWAHTQETLKGGLNRLLEEMGGYDASPDAVFAGISGGTTGHNKETLEKMLRNLLPNARHLANDSDAVNALSSGIRRADGCVVILGTGSVGFVRRAGSVIRVSGWGYLFDRGGSGYDLGRDAVYHALCALDGRGAATTLTHLLEEQLGMRIDMAVTRLYEEGKPTIAALAPLVFEAERAGDKVAMQILDGNGMELAKLLNTLSQKTKVDCCPTVLTGSVFKAWHQLSPYVLPRLTRQHLFVFPTLPPVYGSAVEAMALMQLEVDDEFEQTFAQTLN